MVFFSPASVYDGTESVAQVEFSASPPPPLEGPSLLLGAVSNYVSNPPYRIYSLDWSNAFGGVWLLGAVAVRTNGTAVAAKPVLVTVQNGFSLPVAITNPTNGASYSAPTNLSLVAGVQASNANPAFVEFFDNSSPLAIVSNSISVGPMPGGVYLFEWTNPPPGPHTLTASVTDTTRDVAWSSPVVITIGTNAFSFSISIISPTNGAGFTQPVNVPIDASVLDGRNDVAFVNFTATRVWPPGVMPPSYLIELGAVSNWVSITPPRHDYVFVWSNAPAGNWQVAAAAIPTMT